MNKFSISLAFLSLCACSTEFEEPESFTLSEKTFIVSEESKSSLNGDRVIFNLDDRFCVHDGVKGRNFSVVSGGTNVIIRGEAAESPSYTVIFPFDAFRSVAGKNCRVSLPEIQKLPSNSFDKGSDVLFGISEGNHVDLNHGAGLLKFSISSEDIASIRFIAVGGEGICGDANLIIDGTPALSDASSSSVLAVPDNGSVFKPGMYVLCIAPGVLSRGMEVIIRRTDGTMEHRINNNPISITPGAFSTMSNAIDSNEYVKGDLEDVEKSICWSHPRMFFNTSMIPELRRAAMGSASSYLTTLRKRVDAMDEVPDFSDHGNDAAKCAMMWILTGESRYVDKTKAMLLASIEYYDERTSAGQEVDWYCFSRINALCAYDWIYSELTEAERRAIIVPLVNHVEAVRGKTIGKQTLGYYYGGGYCMDTLPWYSGLAAYGDGFCDKLALDHLHRGYSFHKQMCEFRNLNSGDDGALSVPTMEYAAGYYPYATFNYFMTYKSATSDNIAPSYTDMAFFPQWIWWSWIRDNGQPDIRIAGIGDTFHDRNIATASHLYTILAGFSHFFRESNPDAAGFCSAMMTFGKNTYLNELFPAYRFMFDETPAGLTSKYAGKFETGTLKARHFETAGQVLMRSGWGVDDTYCTFNTGSSKMVSHNHFDQGSFTIYKHDHLALDTGCRAKETDYNLGYYYARSVAHNMVLVHKPNESLPNYWGPKISGTKYNYGGTIKENGAKLLAFKTTGNYTYVATDLSECYGNKCSQVTRQFVYVYPDYFIVYDKVSSTDASYAKEWLLHTQNCPSVTGNITCADAGYGNARLFCETFLPEDASLNLVGGTGYEFMADVNYPLDPEIMTTYEQTAKADGRGPYTGAWRLEVHPGDERIQDTFLNVLTATDTSSSDPIPASLIKSPDSEGIKLIAGGRTYEFKFKKSEAVGCTVSIDGCEENLENVIQPQSGILFDL